MPPPVKYILKNIIYNLLAEECKDDNIRENEQKEWFKDNRDLIKNYICAKWYSEKKNNCLHWHSQNQNYICNANCPCIECAEFFHENYHKIFDNVEEGKYIIQWPAD